MRAARYHGKGDLRVEDVPVPEPRENEVQVEVEWCGICGTDLHDYITGPHLVIPSPQRPHVQTGDHYPLTMGHEFCGRISKVGPGSSLQVGQKVMADPRLPCRSCWVCSSPQNNLCRKMGFVGLAGGHYGGGFGEYAVINEKACYLLPESTDLIDAALIEPLAVARHGLASCGFTDYTKLTALVLGCGPIGLAVMYTLKAAGVKKIIVSEPTIKRQEHAKGLADHIFDPLKDNVPDECRNLTDGRGVDAVFDCAGVQAGYDAAINALILAGTYMNFAVWEKPMQVSMQAIGKEITIRMTMAYTSDDFRETVEDFIAGKYAGAEKMITDRIGLEDVQRKGFDELINNKDEQVKILVTPKTELVK